MDWHQAVEKTLRQQSINQEANTMGIENKYIKKTVAYMEQILPELFTMQKEGWDEPSSTGCIIKYIMIANGRNLFGQDDIYDTAGKLLGISDRMKFRLFAPQNKYADWREVDPNSSKYINVQRAIDQLKCIDITGKVNWNPKVVTAVLANAELSIVVITKQLMTATEMSTVPITASDKEILTGWLALPAVKQLPYISNLESDKAFDFLKAEAPKVTL